MPEGSHWGLAAIIAFVLLLIGRSRLVDEDHTYKRKIDPKTDCASLYASLRPPAVVEPVP
jgi:hypothetical protein